MNTYHSIFDAFFAPIMLLCAGQAIMCVILLLRIKNKPIANYMLALWCTVWGVSCYFFFGYILEEPYLTRSMSTFIGSAIPITLYPPLYLYASYFCSNKKQFNCKDLWHFTPLFVYIIFTTVLFLQEGSISAMRETAAYPIRRLSVSYIAAFQGVFYFIAIKRLIKHQKEKLKQEFSNLEKIKLNWLENINLLSLAVVFFGTLSTIVLITPFDPYPLFMLYHIFMGVSIYYISFTIILKPYFFSRNYPYPSLDTTKYNPSQLFPKQLSEKINLSKVETSKTAPPAFLENISSCPKPEDANHKYEIESLKVEPTVTQKKLPEIIEITEKLNLLMETEKPYIKQILSLQDLADALQISRNQLSFVLNHHLHQNFYDYIHSLRLEECKLRILDPKFANYSILAIAYDSGFNSKTVFYRIFKESEKMTPTEYRQRFFIL